jgi:hypothetical protein
MLSHKLDFKETALRRIFCAVLFFISGLFQAFAQTPQRATTTGILSGIVSDPTGAVIPGVIIHIERHASTTSQIPNATSDAVGNYSVALAPGTYDVTFVAQGFDPFLSAIVIPRAGGTTHLNAALNIATEAEQVNVFANANSTSAEANKSALVLGQADLATMSDDDTTFQQQIQAIAGGDPMQPSGVYVDGFSGGQIPPKESIREIRINQNPYSAQFQELGFGRIEIFTKPGSDKLHGRVNIFATDSTFNSQNPYSGTQPPYYILFARGNLSGPIGKKTSFFLNARYGDTQNNSIINAILPGLVTYNAVLPSPTVNMDFNVRIDRQVTANNVLTARFEYQRSKLTNGGLSGSQIQMNGNGPQAAAVSSQVLQSEANNNVSNISTLQLSDTQNIGMNKVLETRFQWIRNRADQLPAVAATDGIPNYLNGGNTPTYNVSGFFNGGGDPTQQITDHTDQIEFQEYYSLDIGKNFVRVGGRYRGTRDANMSASGYNGAYTYAASPDGVMTALQNFTNGAPSQFTVTTGQKSAALYTGDIGIYADDEYMMRKDLTLNFGFRAESQSAIPDHFDPAPRIGLSWAIGQTDKRQPFVTLRTGFGLFYDRFQSSNILTAVRQQSGTVQQQYVFTLSGTTPTTCTISSAPSCTGGTVTAQQPTLYNINPNLRSEYKVATGLTAEKQFAIGKVSVNYLYLQGDRQWTSRNINAPLPGTFVYGDANSGARPLGGTQNIYQFDSNGKNTSNVVFGNAQLNPTKRINLFLFAVDRLQNSDVSGATSFPTNQYNLKADYGRAAAATFRLFAGAEVTLPYGIVLNPFIGYSSRAPFNITTGTDLNGDTEYNDRPSFATAASPEASVYKTPYSTFNADPVAGETIIPINYGNGPRFVYTELGISRGIHFGPILPAEPAPAGKPAPKPAPPQKRYELSFTAEIDNVFNHRNAGPPVGQVTSPEFGQSLSLNSQFIGSPNANRMIYLGTFFNF